MIVELLLEALLRVVSLLCGALDALLGGPLPPDMWPGPS